MYKIDFKKPIHVHFIGIGGISMSGLAEILLKEGFTVSGSDNKESALTEHLTGKGATIFYGQKASNIIDEIDVVVYTAAIHEDNEEFAEAVRQNIPMLSRAELLGQLMTNYECPIAVSGTHGKTTTTSMLLPRPFGGRERPYDFRRRYFKSNQRQYPCRQLRRICYGSLRIYKQFSAFSAENQYYFKCRRRPHGLFQRY